MEVKRHKIRCPWLFNLQSWMKPKHNLQKLSPNYRRKTLFKWMKSRMNQKTLIILVSWSQWNNTKKLRKLLQWNRTLHRRAMIKNSNGSNTERRVSIHCTKRIRETCTCNTTWRLMIRMRRQWSASSGHRTRPHTSQNVLCKIYRDKFWWIRCLRSKDKSKYR